MAFSQDRHLKYGPSLYPLQGVGRGKSVLARKLVAVNDHGNTIGEDHSRATLTDNEVRLMRELRDSDPDFWSYRKLADKFEVSKKHAWRICQMHQRAQIVDRWVRR